MGGLRWWKMLATAFILLLADTSFGQVNFSQNFDVASTGWTGNFTRFTGTTACGGAGGAMRRNLYSGGTTSTGQLISPSTGTSSGALATITYTYKAAVWSANTAAQSNWGSFQVQYGATATGPWTAIATVVNETQLGNPCISKTHTFTPPVGALFIRWSAQWQSGDYYLNFDNVVITQQAASGCSGTPAPGNTQRSAASACSATAFNLSLQNSISGSGISYAWQRSTDGGANWIAFGTSAPTQTGVTQAATSQYRCVVTCANSGLSGTSNPATVTTLSGVAVCGAYCVPSVPAGCTDGDVIARVQLNTLDNVTGTGCPSGTLGYSNYTTDPALTTTLQAGASYGCTVSAGQYGQGYAAWIDYNDDGTFDNLTERIGFTLATVPGSGVVGQLGGSATFPITLACNPPLGTHRLRVRCIYNTAGSAITPCNAAGYGETEDYVVTISAADPCPAPVNLTAGNSTANSADLSWTLGCAETVWDLHIQNAGGGTPTTPSNPGLTSTSFSATGLAQGQLYEYYVRANCGGNGTSSWVGPRLFAANPANDVCASATASTVSAGTTATSSGFTYGATANEGLTAGTTPVAAVWHSVTLTECLQTLTVSMCGTTPVLPLYYGPLYSNCTGTQVLANGTTNTTTCGDANLTIVYGQLSAGTYYFPVFTADGFNPPSDYDISFTGGTACPPPPANDLCANATAATCGTTYTGTTEFATNTGAPVFGGTCGTGDATARGVWYTISGVCGSTTASLCASSFDTKLFVMGGSCGAFTCVGGNDDGCGAQSTVTWTADAATTYYIYVTGFGTAFGNFSFVVNCAGTPVAATATVVDDCANNQYAIDVNVTDLGGAGSASIVYTVDGGAPTTVSGVGLGVTSVGPFQTSQNVNVTVNNGTLGCAASLGEFSSNCPIGIICGTTTTVNYCYKNNDTKSWTFSTTSPGETVTLSFVSGTIDENTDIVRIYDGLDNSGTLLATSTVNSLAGLTATSIGPDLYMEVDSDPAGSCQDGNQSSWTFEVECTPGCVDPDGSVTVTTDCSTYSFSIAVEVLFTGDAPNGTTSVSYTVNGGAATVVPNLVDLDIANIGPFTVDDQVAVQLLHETDPLCNRNLGTFTDNNTCPPLSENCLSAQNLATLTSPFSSTTTGFVNDVTYTNGCQSNTSPDRVFYIDIPNLFSITIGQTVNGYDSENLVAWGGACPGTNVLACYDDPDIQNTTWLNNTGSTQRLYWVQDGYFNAGNAGTFTLAWSLTAPCSGTPSPGAALSSAATACPLTNFNLSLTTPPTGVGITHQWFVSTVSDAGPWTPISGATATTLTTNQSAASWYYCASTCVTGPNTGNSTPVFVGLNNDPIACLCTPTYTFGKTDGDLISNVAITGTTLSNNTGTDPVNPAFTFFNTLPNHTGTLQAGTSYGIQITYGSFASQHCAVWIDFNENGVFETPGERVGFTTAASTSSFETAAFTLSLPCNPTPGVKRMRVRNVYFTAGNTIDPCANYGYGETEDYNVTVSAPPPCPVPGGLAAGAVTTTTASLSWTAGCTETAWQVQYGLSGFTLGNGTTVSATTASASLTGLAGGTAFQAYVRADCDANGFSNWIGPVSFNTPPLNDLCAGAIAVACNSVTEGSTAGSTNADAPALCGTALNTVGGVWYTIAGWDGTMTASLCGSSFDTKIGVFTGSCGALTCVIGEDDDFTVCGDNDPSVTWTGTSGTTYYIYVTGFGAESGNFTLTTSCGSNNSNCAANGLTMEFQTDATPFETTWEIRNAAGTVVATSGGPLVAPFGVQTESGCVPNGCYTLRVLDAGGDGMTTGGYILRTQGTNQRIIDNRNNFNTGSISAISGGQGFCLPLSNDKVLFTSCDKLDWTNGQYVVASPNAAVSAEWIVNGANSVQDNNSGYEFWIFDPNGSYSFRRFRSHNVSDNYASVGATRACYMKLNNWPVASQVPANVLMNVRVRPRVNGVNGEFGPACRLMIDPVRAACPLTNLMDVPGSSQFSCNVIRQYGANNYVYARPVTGANRYQFRFRLPAEGVEVVRTATNYILQLNWTGPTALQDGRTYDVDVRVSKDAGLTWCTSSDPWGNICSVTIDQTPAGSGNQNFAAAGSNAELRMFPNPNRGDVLTFSLSAIEEGVNTVTMDIYDLFGKRVSARTVAVSGGNVNTNIALNGELAAGMYLVNITAGDKTYTERLVIQP